MLLAALAPLVSSTIALAQEPPRYTLENYSYGGVKNTICQTKDGRVRLQYNERGNKAGPVAPFAMFDESGELTHAVTYWIDGKEVERYWNDATIHGRLIGVPRPECLARLVSKSEEQRIPWRTEVVTQVYEDHFSTETVAARLVTRTWEYELELEWSGRCRPFPVEMGPGSVERRQLYCRRHETTVFGSGNAAK